LKNFFNKKTFFHDKKFQFLRQVAQDLSDFLCATRHAIGNHEKSKKIFQQELYMKI